MDSYDTIPYPAMPLPHSHPGHLGALARLAGLAPPPVDGCRVLELGCASGGNLIPMAARLPNSRFVGIERSLVQARQGQEAVAQLGLSNCQILAMDLLDYAPEAGSFDYVLAHGLYSWAPDAVQQRILSLCRHALAPHGLALVSFNALPGWHMRGMLREMLLDQTRHGRTPTERLTLGQGFLKQYLSVLSESEALAARHLTLEIRRLLDDNPAYLYHEYLEEENHPILFRTFAGQIAHQGLQFLCDADPAFWFPTAIGEQGESLLETIADPLEREQTLDFLMLRTFREAVICQDQAPVSRGLDFAAMESLAIFSGLRPPPRLLLNQNQAQPFFTQAGSKIAINHPLSRAALHLLWTSYPGAMDWQTLSAQARDMVAKAGASHRAEEMDHLAGELFSLFLQGEVGLTLQADPMPTNPNDFPKTSALSKLCSTEGWLPSRRHGALPLDPMDHRLLDLLDGTRDLDALTLAMLGPEASPDAGRIKSQLRRLRPWLAEKIVSWHQQEIFVP